MQLIELLHPELTFCGLEVRSKKNLVGQIAKLITQQVPDIDSNDLFDELIAREKLGSTGVGEGVGIPHCRIDHCHEPIGALIKLQEPIDFDANDGCRVDLVFVLLVPKMSTDEHLQLLSEIAELLNQGTTRQIFRQATSNDELYQAAKKMVLDQAVSQAS